jgi:hypothetical protein
MRNSPIIRRARQAHPPPTVPADYVAEVDLEYARWSELVGLIGMLSSDELLAPGYFRDPDWSVKDLVAHLRAWLAEAASQLASVAARSYQPQDVDIDARNAEALEVARRESWESVWTGATMARAQMLQAWFSLREPSESANRWVRKAGAEHYGEHLDRLREWVGELVEGRTRPPSTDWDS